MAGSSPKYLQARQSLREPKPGGALSTALFVPPPEYVVSTLLRVLDGIGFDAERVAFMLLEKIYHRFGFASADVPYASAEDGVQRISAARVVDRPLPT